MAYKDMQDENEVWSGNVHMFLGLNTVDKSCAVRRTKIAGHILLFQPFFKVKAFSAYTAYNFETILKPRMLQSCHVLLFLK